MIASCDATKRWETTLADMTPFGRELARIRGARTLTKSQLARLTGLHVNTIHRYEVSTRCILTPGSAVRLLQAYAACDPPITMAEALFIADAVGINRATAATFVKDRSISQADSLQMGVRELVSIVGETAANRLIAQVVETLKAVKPPSATRVMIHKSQPVQKPGYIEQIETEYIVQDQPAEPKPMAEGA